MPQQLIVDNITFNYPLSGDSPEWGEEASAWAKAVTDVLNTLKGQGDILNTDFTINNNVSSATNINGLFFDPSTVRGAIVEYTIYRVTTGGGAQEVAETGTLYLSYKSTAATWELARYFSGDGGVTFSMSGIVSGQLQYVSTNMTGSNHSGQMTFRARAFLQ